MTRNILSSVFLLQVNHQNVVKMGHRQVVNMIKHGGNRLVLKVVTVSRNLEQDDKTPKKGTKHSLHMCSQDKCWMWRWCVYVMCVNMTEMFCVVAAPPPPKRAPTTALSMRSKSMTTELEELGELNLINYCYFTIGSLFWVMFKY